MKPAPPVTNIMRRLIRALDTRRKRVRALEWRTEMAERPRILDDLAGVAGGALSALTGLREEAEAIVRARVDETLRRLDVVRRDEVEAIAELAANARTGQEAAESRLAEALERLTALEARVASLENPPAEDAVENPD
jgi:BMFP domain-containing protein YqiC